jgi:hypothetical protein
MRPFELCTRTLTHYTMRNGTTRCFPSVTKQHTVNFSSDKQSLLYARLAVKEVLPQLILHKDG